MRWNWKTISLCLGIALLMLLPVVNVEGASLGGDELQGWQRFYADEFDDEIIDGWNTYINDGTNITEKNDAIYLYDDNGTDSMLNASEISSTYIDTVDYSQNIMIHSQVKLDYYTTQLNGFSYIEMISGRYEYAIVNFLYNGTAIITSQLYGQPVKTYYVENFIDTDYTYNELSIEFIGNNEWLVKNYDTQVSKVFEWRERAIFESLNIGQFGMKNFTLDFVELWKFTENRVSLIEASFFETGINEYNNSEQIPIKVEIDITHEEYGYEGFEIGYSCLINNTLERGKTYTDSNGVAFIEIYNHGNLATGYEEVRVWWDDNSNGYPDADEPTDLIGFYLTDNPQNKTDTPFNIGIEIKDGEYETYEPIVVEVFTSDWTTSDKENLEILARLDGDVETEWKRKYTDDDGDTIFVFSVSEPVDNVKVYAVEEGGLSVESESFSVYLTSEEIEQEERPEGFFTPTKLDGLFIVFALLIGLAFVFRFWMSPAIVGVSTFVAIARYLPYYSKLNPIGTFLVGLGLSVGAIYLRLRYGKEIDRMPYNWNPFVSSVIMLVAISFILWAFGGI